MGKDEVRYRALGAYLRDKEHNIDYFHGFVEESLRNYFHDTHGLSWKHAGIMAGHYVLKLRK